MIDYIKIRKLVSIDATNKTYVTVKHNYKSDLVKLCLKPFLYIKSKVKAIC